MLKNLIKTAVRHMFKHFGYSILNIVGLTLGISSALFLIIYVTDEVSYDRYHEKADRIYRVSSKITETDLQGFSYPGINFDSYSVPCCLVFYEQMA